MMDSNLKQPGKHLLVVFATMWNSGRNKTGGQTLKTSMISLLHVTMICFLVHVA